MNINRQTATRSALTLAGMAGLLLVNWGCASRSPRPAPTAYEMHPWSFGQVEGRLITTEHYAIRTTVTDARLIETFPELMERAWRYYAELVPPARTTAEPLKVYLFATRGQWIAYTHHFTGPRAATYLKVRGGGYSERGVSVIQYVAHQITFPVLAHEGLHQYLYHCVNPEVPAWINEGLAVVCEGQHWTARGLERFDRWYNPLRRNQLAEALLRNRLYPLRELLSTNAGNIIQETSTRVGTYYAQVWALMLFLWEGQEGKYAVGFQNLLNSLGAEDLRRRVQAEGAFAAGPPPSGGEALFRSFISDDLESVEREYVAFLRERILNGR